MRTRDSGADSGRSLPGEEPGETGLSSDAHRTEPDPLQVELVPGPPLGPHMRTADPATFLAACRTFDPEGSWEAISGRIIPMLPRERPYPVPSETLVQTVLPPGIPVGLGVDLGPALVMVAHDQLARWGIAVEAAVATALENVRRAAAGCSPESVEHSMIGGVDVGLLQSGVGIASALLLVPDCIERFVGRGPHLLLAPARDLLVVLPGSTDRRFAAWLASELEAEDPNHLHLGTFVFEAGAVEAARPVDRPARA